MTLAKNKAFYAIAVIACFFFLFAERQIDRMTEEMLALGQQVREQQEIIDAQQELIGIYREQNEALGSLLGQASDALRKIVYGPYSREEVQTLVSQVADIIEGVNEALTEEETLEISQAIVETAVAAGIDPLLLVAMAITESHCRPNARGGSGEYGILQIMPGTGKWIAGRLGYKDWTPEDLLDVKTNIQFGTFYLRAVTREFRNTQQGVLAYNRGSYGARKWLQENSPEEHLYVRKVMGTYRKLKGV